MTAWITAAAAEAFALVGVWFLYRGARTVRRLGGQKRDSRTPRHE